MHMNGIGGLHMELQQAGYLNDFFEEYASKEMHVSILSFSEVEDTQ
jgi:hypothetical protein